MVHMATTETKGVLAGTQEEQEEDPAPSPHLFPWGLHTVAKHQHPSHKSGGRHPTGVNFIPLKAKS